jgi:hypothetical protein
MLDEAVARLAAGRRTFTDEEALAAIWKAGYDVSPQSDPRFALAREADGRNPRHWRLEEQALANNLLLEALRAGTWDGRDTDGELARLSAAHGVHYVFCPADPRFEARADGTLEPSDREKDVSLPAPVRAELDRLLSGLLDRWQGEGGAPRTVREVAAALVDLGWPHAAERGGWLLVRAWLLLQPALRRVGQDYWVPAGSVPTGPGRTRLSVIPVFIPPGESGASATAGSERPSQGAAGPAPSPPAGVGAIPPEASAVETRWTATLRTVHLVEGFIPVPAPQRCAYPPRAKQSGDWEVLRGEWFETGDELWVWLDRQRDLLCGPDLAGRLAWCEAGDQIDVLWTAEVLVFRSLGVDEEVRREESRLADREALAELRGGLGESYHRSLTAILSGAPDGLGFRDLVTALCARQRHEVHRGTVRAILHAGGFVYRAGRWFGAVNPAEGMRRLRRTMVAAPEDSRGATDDTDRVAGIYSLGDVAKAVKIGLRRVVGRLTGGPTPAPRVPPDHGRTDG